MLKIIVLKGIPASSKTTWAKDFVSKDPLKWVRISNDDLRASFNQSIWSKEYETLVKSTREFLIRECLKRNLNIVIDNTNVTSKHFDDVVKIAKSVNKSCVIEEKCFYVELDQAIWRDSFRSGSAKVGEEVIKKFYKQIGGNAFKNYVPRTEAIIVENNIKESKFTPAVQDTRLAHALIVDLDGTLAKIGDRSVYSAENCDVIDTLNEHVAKTVQLYYNDGYKVLFCSGREDKYEAPTRRFIEKHLPGMQYELFMRRSGDFKKDDIVKQEIYNNHIKNNYYIHLVLDDRLSVCRLWHRLGLNLLRVGDPDSDF